MTFERSSAPVPAEPGPPALSIDAGTSEPASPAMRLQILSTEHWSLLASRSLAWNEVFARVGMFLSALSGAIVALALVGQGTGFGQSFALFAIVILPVVLFLGVTTVVRLSASLYHDAQCVIGMNRIRGAYLELAPELARYFVMSPHDDARGVGITMAFPPGHIQIVQILAATPTIASVINSVIVGALVGLIAGQLAPGGGIVLVVSVAGFIATFLAHAAWGRAAIARNQARVQPVFPSPPEA
jgi:uncharacterized membrane protein YeaQ/YmgE (transglycosylase-associated protein family)